jgi:hypothetical protein
MKLRLDDGIGVSAGKLARKHDVVDITLHRILHVAQFPRASEHAAISVSVGPHARSGHAIPY